MKNEQYPYTESVRQKVLKILDTCEPLPTQSLEYQSIYKICKEEIKRAIIECEF